MKFLFFLSTLSFLAIINGGEVPTRIVEENDSVFFNCSNIAPVKQCLLMYNSEIKADRTNDIKLPRFEILDTTHGIAKDACVIKFSNLTSTDSGIYICHLDDDNEVKFDLIVAEKAGQPQLMNGSEPIANNSDPKIFVPNEYFNLSCEVVSGSRETTPLTWYIDDEEVSATGAQTIPGHDQLHYYQSWLDLEASRFEKSKELTIKCVVDYLALETKKTALFTIGKRYNTQKVTLKFVDDSTEEVLCVADGLPRPKDMKGIKIEKLFERNNWTMVSKNSTAFLTEPGIYACRARNNGTLDYVESNKLELSDDKEKTGSASIGTILAIIFGSLAVLVVMAMALLCCRKRRRPTSGY